MANHRKQEAEHDNTERWLLTYSDLITLMMAFFVILFAMASVDAKKVEAVAQSLAIAFSSGGTGLGANMLTNYNGTGFHQMTVKITENDELKSLVKMIDEYAANEGISSSIRTSITERGLVINLADSVLFDSGRVDLTPKASQILDKMGDLLLKTGKMIRVEGHTDNLPIHTARYQSNWQLSTDRATTVIMYWLSKMPEAAGRLSAGGYGEFRPIAPNDTPENRARNRRVDIVVLRNAVAKDEPEALKQNTMPGSNENSKENNSPVVP